MLVLTDDLYSEVISFLDLCEEHGAEIFTTVQSGVVADVPNTDRTLSATPGGAGSASGGDTLLVPPHSGDARSTAGSASASVTPGAGSSHTVQARSTVSEEARALKRMYMKVRD